VKLDLLPCLIKSIRLILRMQREIWDWQNAIFEYLSAKLPVSRLQRDLTDSTVIRNIGVPLAHSVVAFHSIIKGMDKLVLHEEKLRKDLDDNWAVISEAIQTFYGEKIIRIPSRP